MARDIKEVESELRSALDKAVARGARPVRGCGDGVRCGCALQLYGETETFYYDGLKLFDRDEKEFPVSSFIAGWDGLPKSVSYAKNEDLYNLGRRLAKEYVDRKAA